MDEAKRKAEKGASSSVMVTNATDRDIRTLQIFEREEGLEGELTYHVYRLVGDKFVLIVFSLQGDNTWKTITLPKLVLTFGEERCRYETKALDPIVEPVAVPNPRSRRRGANG